MAKSKRSEARPSTSSHPRMSGLPMMSGYVASGPRPLVSGSPFGSGWHAADAFLIECEVEQSTALAFQLAPRLFVVSRHSPAATGSSTESGEFVESGGPLEHLPPHLSFRETSAAAGRSQQQWVSEDDGPWKWELVVRHDAAAVEAILTARQSSDGRQTARHVWKARGGWDSFGINRLDPDHSGCEAVALIIAAP